MAYRKLDSGNPEVDSAAFRRTLGQYGTGVTVVTCNYNGADFGVTSNSFASVSLAPPLVLWSIKKENESYQAFLECGFFAINVLAKDQMAISNKFAKSGGEKFADISFSRGLGHSPIIEDTVAVFQCSRFTQYEGGDHTILVGKVKEFTRYDRQALMFSQGQYAAIDMAAFTAPLLAESTAPGGLPASSRYDLLATRLRLAFGSLFARLGNSRKDVNLSHAQAAIANALLQSPGLSESEVAVRLGFGFNSTDFEFAKLKDEGLVQTDADGRMSLTQSGKDKIMRLREKWTDLEDEALSGFSSSEIALMRRMLDHIIAM